MRKTLFSTFFGVTLIALNATDPANAFLLPPGENFLLEDPQIISFSASIPSYSFLFASTEYGSGPIYFDYSLGGSGTDLWEMSYGSGTYYIAGGTSGNLDLGPEIPYNFIVYLTYLGTPDPDATVEFSDSPTSLSATPVPAALPLFATGAGVISLLGRRRKRKDTVGLRAA